jgi:hypothetical protein
VGVGWGSGEPPHIATAKRPKVGLHRRWNRDPQCIQHCRQIDELLYSEEELLELAEFHSARPMQDTLFSSYEPEHRAVA